jgi:hypothetical protein
VSERGRIGGAIRQAVAARKAARSWSIDVPKGWELETEDMLDTFFDPDGVGALQVSSLTKSGGDVTDAELIESIEDMKLADRPRAPAAFGPFTGYALEKVHDDGQAGRYWFLRAGPLLLFVTYFCDKQDAGKEARIVAKALSTLRLSPDARS